MIDQHRVIVVGLVRNAANELLLCKMAKDRGVFPNQWGLPGGGIETGEKMEGALRRELQEELGIKITDIKPVMFKDGTYEKSFPGNIKKTVYMIFLIFQCKALDESLNLNEEFVEYRWVKENELKSLELNTETIDTLRKAGYNF